MSRDRLFQAAPSEASMIENLKCEAIANVVALSGHLKVEAASFGYDFRTYHPWYVGVHGMITMVQRHFIDMQAVFTAENVENAWLAADCAPAKVRIGEPDSSYKGRFKGGEPHHSIKHFTKVMLNQFVDELRTPFKDQVFKIVPTQTRVKFFEHTRLFLIPEMATKELRCFYSKLIAPWLTVTCTSSLHAVEDCVFEGGDFRELKSDTPITLPKPGSVFFSPFAMPKPMPQPKKVTQTVAVGQSRENFTAIASGGVNHTPATNEDPGSTTMGSRPMATVYVTEDPREPVVRYVTIKEELDIEEQADEGAAQTRE